MGTNKQGIDMDMNMDMEMETGVVIGMYTVLDMDDFRNSNIIFSSYIFLGFLCIFCKTSGTP
jgi:hypothetical protein